MDSKCLSQPVLFKVLPEKCFNDYKELNSKAWNPKASARETVRMGESKPTKINALGLYCPILG
jgi:hypothetical protein